MNPWTTDESDLNHLEQHSEIPPDNNDMCVETDESC